MEVLSSKDPQRLTTPSKENSMGVYTTKGEVEVDLDERYRFYVLDPLSNQASEEVWQGFIEGDFDLNWFDQDSFEIFNGKELVGTMDSGVWNER